MIDLTFVRGSVDDPSLRRLTDELVTVLLRAERAPDTPFLRDNTSSTCTRWSRPRSQWEAADPASLDFGSS
jgi:hypothetical protein